MLNIQSDRTFILHSQSNLTKQNQTNHHSENQEDIFHLKKRKVHKLIKQQLIKKNQNKQLPTVRKMIEVINSPILFNSESTSIHQQKSLENSQFSSFNLSQSKINNDSTNKLKNISKILSLKKEEIQRIQLQNHHKKQDDIKKVIFNLIDQIHNAKNSKAFYSQPHFAKGLNSENKKAETFRLLKNSNIKIVETGIEYVSVPQSYKTLQTSRQRSEIGDNKKISMKFEQMNRIQTQKAYLNTMKQLDINKKFELQKRNLYHTIDPNRTQKWFNKIQNSNKKISRLFKQKQELSKQKTQNLIKLKHNQLVQRLVQKSNKKMLNSYSQIKQITQSKDKNRSIIVKDRKYFDHSQYKVKQRQYFHIEIKKKSLGKQLDKQKKNSLTKSLDKQKKNSLTQLLPQIKVNGRKNII